MTGIDLLVTNLLKASGVDPEKLKEDIQNYSRNLALKIDSMDRSIHEIQVKQEEILKVLESLLCEVNASGDPQPVEASIRVNGGAAK